MRNCATYNESGIELPECPKVNFIYGTNGSGKSTISNYFQDTTEPKYADCSVEREFRVRGNASPHHDHYSFYSLNTDEIAISTSSTFVQQS